MKFKSLMIFTIIFSLMCTPFMASATEVIITDPTPDTTPPVLLNLSISTNEATAGSSVKLTAEVSDDLSGIGDVYLYYSKPSGKSDSYYFTLNQTTNKYETTINFNQYSESGTWKLTQIYLCDKKGNFTSISRNTMDFSPYFIQVTGSEDVAPPVLNNVSISQSEVTKGGSLKLIADVTDDSTGVYSVHGYFVKPSGKERAVYLSLNSSSNLYEGTISIDQYEELGTWKLRSIVLADKVQNTKYIYDSSYSSTSVENMDFSNCNFQVTGTTPDLLSPVLETLGISLEQITNNGAVVKLTAMGSDNLSGVSSFSGNYTKPNGQSYYINFLRYAEKYIASIPIDKYDQLGTWKLRSITLCDNKENYVAIADSFGGSYGGQTMDFSPFHFTVRGVITIPPPTPFSIGISPKTITLDPGTSQQLQVNLNMSDTTTKDITSSSTGTVYTSSNPTSVKVDQNGLVSVEPNASPGVVYIQAANSGLYQQCEITIPGGTPESTLSIKPLSMNLSPGQRKQLSVVASLEDGTTKDVTQGTTGTEYSSSDPSRVAVDQNGLVTILSTAQQGTSKILINHNGIRGEAVVNVTGPPTIKSLVMTPEIAEVAAGETIQLSVRAILSDGSTKDVTSGASGTVFSTSNNRATVNADGLISIPADANSGTVTIQAENNGIKVNSIVTVNGVPKLSNLVVNSGTQSLTPGGTLQVSVLAVFSDQSTSDVTKQAILSSSNPDLAVVDENGVVSIPLNATSGTVYIRATYNGKGAACTITVNAPTKIVNALTVFPGTATMKPDSTQQLIVTAQMADGSNQEVTSEATYSSSNPAVATVDENGLIKVPTNATNGTAYIRVAYNGKGAACTVTVNVQPKVIKSLLVSPGTATMKPDSTQQLIVTAQMADGSNQEVTSEATYSSSNPAVATVDENGLIKVPTNATNGTAYIRVAYNGKGAACTVTVNVQPKVINSLLVSPGTATMKPDSTQQLIVTAQMADGSNQEVTSEATYSSSNPAVATVDANGVITVPANGTNGTTYIRVAYNGKGAACTVTVTRPTLSKIIVSPTPITLTPGSQQELNVTAIMSDGTSQDVTAISTFSSSNTRLAIVNQEGVLYIPPEAPNGTVYIRASYNGKGAASTVTVKR